MALLLFVLGVVVGGVWILSLLACSGHFRGATHEPDFSELDPGTRASQACKA